MEISLGSTVRVLLFGMALSLCACAAQSKSQPQSQAQSQSQSQPAAKKEVRGANRFIYVSDKGLPGSCYHDLGEVDFSEPYAQASIDPSNVAAAEQLRKIAMEKYPHTVDAVINVHSQQNEVGTFVKVTGEAVELEHHDTVECTVRSIPGVIDKTATLAAGGVAGTILGGLGTNTTNGAMTGAGLGIAATGAYQAMKHQEEVQALRAKITDQLTSEKREIDLLQTQREQLRKCQQQEISLADCHLTTILPQGDKTKDEVKINWDNSTFELEKQIQEQQVYIHQLHDEVAGLRRQLGGF